MSYSSSCSTSLHSADAGEGILSRATVSQPALALRTFGRERQHGSGLDTELLATS